MQNRFVRFVHFLPLTLLTLTLPATGATIGTTSSDRVDPLPEGLASSDWSGIRAAYEEGRHAVRPVPGGHRARNPRQQWNTVFDGRGFTTKPDAGSWTWGLELESYGFADQLKEVERPEHVSTDGNRVAYDWDDGLQEWYLNDGRGLEHGYTLHRRLAQTRASVEAPLVFTLAVRGELTASLQENRLDVSFLDDSGATALTYSGLKVFDAEGRTLPAHFELAGDQLRLLVDESDARYPLTIDPVAQQTYLKSSNSDPGDAFGLSVAVSGDTVVVGAPREDSAAVGVNGSQDDNSASFAGAVYVFVRDGAVWTQQAYLKASNTGVGDTFGDSVSISGDTIVVGAPWEDSEATGVNGEEEDDSARQSGAAYVFVRNGSTWSQQAYLKASNAGAGDQFGESVAVSGDSILIGAYREESSATGSNGNQADNSLPFAGAAYMFERNGSSWSQSAYLKASNAGTGDCFGLSVALSGDIAVVGALNEDGSATGVNGNWNDDGATDSGAAYVFARNGPGWIQAAYLKASNTDEEDLFGYAVAVSGDTLVVGATREDSNSTGVNGSQGNDVNDFGAAYVFVHNAGVWSQEAYLKASTINASLQFGESVAVAGDKVAIGATNESSNEGGVNGNENNTSAFHAGAVYVFERNGTTWSQEAYVKASNSDAEDQFGIALAMTEDFMVVGADEEDSSSSGVNGNQGNNGSLNDSGAAYVFGLGSQDPGMAFCFGDGSGAACPCGANGNPGEGCANTGGTGGATLSASGHPGFTVDTFEMFIDGIPGAKAGLAIKGSATLGGGNGNLVGDGLLCTSPQIRSQVMMSNNTGRVTMTNWRGQSFVSYPGAANAPGTPTYYQWWYRDPAGTCSGQGFNFTNAWVVTWAP